jgi:hypothetical protein
MAQKKTLTLALIALFLISTISIYLTEVKAESSPLSSIRKPSTPLFNITIVDRSYDVPVTYSNYTNPYTGKQTTTKQGGYHVTNNTIDLTIKKQPFTPITLDNGYSPQLYYDIRWKGHFENWTDANDPDQYKTVPASGFENTVITYVIGQSGLDIPKGGEIDFQVKAEVGYYHPYSDGHSFPIGIEFETVQESDWTATQTFADPSDSTLNPTNPTWTLSLDKLIEITAITAVIALLLAVVSLLLYRRHRKSG